LTEPVAGELMQPNREPRRADRAFTRPRCDHDLAPEREVLEMNPTPTEGAAADSSSAPEPDVGTPELPEVYGPAADGPEVEVPAAELAVEPLPRRIRRRPGWERPDGHDPADRPRTPADEATLDRLILGLREI
jgi:hypothetical protein